ncbi:MAG: hypothetical protein ACI4TI_03105 [Christensenellales bacterium]
MILDHGVRTLYENTLRKGYMLERDGKYDMALTRYTDALNIAKSCDDVSEVSRCNNIIEHLKTKSKHKENSQTF